MKTTITVTQEVDFQAVSGVLCSAFEGGSNYWYMIEKYIKPKVWEFGEEYKKQDGSIGHWTQDYPLNKGGALIISSQEEPEKGGMRLDLAAIKKGLQIMSRLYPTRYAEILDDYDAETGDVLLQCCLFGDLIYS